MKHLCLLIAFLSFLSCKAQGDNEDLAKEVIISGRVLNREVYPKEKEVTLVIPYLSEMETVYTSPIADDALCLDLLPVRGMVADGAAKRDARQYPVRGGLRSHHPKHPVAARYLL